MENKEFYEFYDQVLSCYHEHIDIKLNGRIACSVVKSGNTLFEKVNALGELAKFESAISSEEYSTLGKKSGDIVIVVTFRDNDAAKTASQQFYSFLQESKNEVICKAYQKSLNKSENEHERILWFIPVISTPFIFCGKVK